MERFSRPCYGAVQRPIESSLENVCDCNQPWHLSIWHRFIWLWRIRRGNYFQGRRRPYYFSGQWLYSLRGGLCFILIKTIYAIDRHLPIIQVIWTHNGKRKKSSAQLWNERKSVNWICFTYGLIYRKWSCRGNIRPSFILVYVDNSENRKNTLKYYIREIHVKSERVHWNFGEKKFKQF